MRTGHFTVKALRALRLDGGGLALRGTVFEADAVTARRLLTRGDAVLVNADDLERLREAIKRL